MKCAGAGRACVFPGRRWNCAKHKAGGKISGESDRMKCKSKGNGRISESLLRGAAVSATAFAALTGALGATSSAFAQESTQEGAQGVEDIVVTAQRRESQLQETPSAVSAFTAETLEAMPVSNVGDVVEFVPNVTRTSGPSGGNDGFFFVRGIGQVDSNPAGDPGVGMYIDDVYIYRIRIFD